MAFLHALKASNHLQPPYAAAVVLELHDLGGDDLGSYGVKVIYKNDTTPTELDIPGIL